MADQSSRKSSKPSDIVTGIKERRVEDQLRLRELELQTDFRIQNLSDSLDSLKREFHSWRDALNTKMEGIEKQVQGQNTRLTALIVLIIASMTDAAPALMKLLV